MPIFSSTITDLASNKMPQPYYRFDGIYDSGNAGASDKIDLGDVGFIDDLTQFSVSVWFKAESSAQNDVVIFSKDNQIECWIKWDSNNRYALSVNNDHVDFTNSTTPIGEWVHVVWTWNVTGDVRKVYQNGVFIQSGSGNEDGVDINSGNVGLSIGARAAGHYPTNAEISSIQFYNNELTATEVKELYSGASVPFKYKGATNTNVMTNANAANPTNESNATGNWSSRNGATITSDATTWTGSSGSYSIKVVTTGSNTGVWGNVNADTYAYSILGNGSLTTGKKYRMTYSVNVTAGSGTAECYTLSGGGGTQHDTSTFSSGITNVTKDFIAEGTSMYFAIIGGTNSTYYLDNWKVVPIGAVAEYDGSGISSDKWFDKSGNDLHGTVSGATVENAPSGDSGLVYEEGTMTPTILLGGTEISTNSGTYNTAQTMGSYTRIGNRVLFNMRVGITAKGGATGAMRVAGLPYTPASSPNAVSAASLTMWVISYADTPFANIDEGSTSVGLFETTNAGTYSTLTEGNIGAPSFIQVAGQYHI